MAWALVIFCQGMWLIYEVSPVDFGPSNQDAKALKRPSKSAAAPSLQQRSTETTVQSHACVATRWSSKEKDEMK